MTNHTINSSNPIPPKQIDYVNNLIFVSCLVVSGLIAWFFHDKTWYGPDDGYFWYVSEQILDGKILQKDIPVIHSGLSYLINTYFLQLAGGDLVGLRYPLVLLTIVQTGFAYKLAEKYGILISVSTALAAIGFSFIQFVMPTPNWYAPCFAMIVLYIFSRQNTQNAKTIILIGFLVGLVFFLRQLTGVILAVAVTTAIFLKNSNVKTEKPYVAGKLIIYLLALATSFYVIKVAKLTGFFVIGLFPLVVLILSARICVVSARRSIEIIFLLVCGAIISAIPLIVYFGLNGALVDWLYGVFVRPFTFLQQPIFQNPNIFTIPGYGAKALVSGELRAIAGLVYWLLIIFAPMALCITVIKKLLSRKGELPIAGIIACTFSLVAIHYEDYVYLLYCIAIVLTALLITVESKSRQKWCAYAIAMISFIAIFCHGGQPRSRGYANIAMNSKMDFKMANIPTTSIIVPDIEAERYEQIVDVISRCSGPTESIYVFPMNPEIYIMSKRANAFKFHVSFIGLETKTDFYESETIFNGNNAPSLVLHWKEDTANLDIATKLWNSAISNYKELGKVEPWTVYKRQDLIESISCFAIDE